MLSTPNYFNVQEINEGFEKSSRFLLTAGTAMLIGGRRRWVRVLGATALAGSILIDRKATAWHREHELRLPVVLPPATSLALAAALKKPHRGRGNMEIQFAVNELARACESTGAPRHLLLDADSGDDQWDAVLVAHARLVKALADHHSAPLEGR